MKQNTTNTQKTPIYLRPAFIPSIILMIALFGAAYYIFNHSFLSPRNYAREVATPLQNALIEAGGTKMCESGDNGRGLDNRRPWFGVTYKFSNDQTAAKDLVYQVSSQNGYALVAASPSNRGPLGGVADEFIRGWYFDNTSRDSSFSDLEAGKVELTFKILSEGETDDCTNSPIESGHTTIGIGVSMPTFR